MVKKFTLIFTLEYIMYSVKLEVLACHNVVLMLQGKCFKTLQGHTDAITCLLLLPAGQLASGSQDTTIRIWDYKMNVCLKILRGHSHTVVCLQLLRSGQLVSCSPDNTVRVWDYKTGICLKTLRRHAFSANGLTSANIILYN